jgi:hypothetical protein
VTARTRVPDLGFAPPPRPLVLALPTGAIEHADQIALGVRGLDMVGATEEECARVAALCEELALHLRRMHREAGRVMAPCRGV